MAGFLQTTVDKFTFSVADDRLYAADGTWVQLRGTNCVRLGVSDFLQQHNGDVAFVTPKPRGTEIAVGDEFADIETMKVTVGVASPVAGIVAAVNDAAVLKPELINQDPYGDGWLVEVQTKNWEIDRAKLLDPRGYLVVMQEEAESELRA